MTEVFFTNVIKWIFLETRFEALEKEVGCNARYVCLYKIERKYSVNLSRIPDYSQHINDCKYWDVNGVHHSLGHQIEKTMDYKEQ